MPISQENQSRSLVRFISIFSYFKVLTYSFQTENRNNRDIGSLGVISLSNQLSNCKNLQDIDLSLK